MRQTFSNAEPPLSHKSLVFTEPNISGITGLHGEIDSPAKEQHCYCKELVLS